MREAIFDAQAMTGQSGFGGATHGEHCYGHVDWDLNDDGLGFGEKTESTYVELDGLEDPGFGVGLPRKPLEEYTTKEVGAKGERIAASYLASHGLRILEMNWRCKAGEVDIVATTDGPEEDMRRSVVLVEVKTRLALGDEADCMPEIAVGPKKRSKYRLLGLLYLVEHPEVDSVRFDVVAVNVLQDERAQLNHLICAYSWDD